MKNPSHIEDPMLFEQKKKTHNANLSAKNTVLRNIIKISKISDDY
jgi:hypothetical protein